MATTALAKIQRMPRGIEGYQGKEQVAVAVTGGRKVLKSDGKPGGVEGRDFFHITYPDEDRTGVKPYHPAYEAFNKAPKEKRKVLYGVLTHIQEEDAFWYERKAQQLPVSYYRNFDWFKQLRSTQQSVSHPKRFPACCGGAKDDHGKVIARRWVGPEAKDFRIIECPGDGCEFSIRTDKVKRPPCSPSLEFLFTLMWKKEDFPTLRPATARYTSKGKQTLAYFIGFFQKIARAIKILGIENPVLYGFPFMLSMGENTNPEEKWNWPVITITELMTPMEFFAEQLRQRKELRETSLQIPAVITVSEEMEQRPTIYTMDEPGPLHIGKQSQGGVNGAAIVTVEPEILADGETVEKRATMPLEQFSKPATNLETSEVEKSIPGKAEKAVDTKKEAGSTSKNGHISEKQVSIIIELIDEGWNQKFFTAWMKGVHRIDRIEDLAAENYDKFIASLKKQISGVKKR